MKITKYISVIVFFMTLISCGQKTIQIDKEPVKGTTENAKKVIDFAESKLKDIKSIHAHVISTKDSDMYGFEETSNGNMVVKFGGKPGTAGDIWFDSNQVIKGKKIHIKGVKTSEGLKELHLDKKKVVKGGKNAESAAWIIHALGWAYNDANYYNRMRDWASDERFSINGQSISNVWLEAVEDIYGTQCYVLAEQNPAIKQMVKRYYYGVEDGMYYGNSTEVNDEDGRQMSKTLLKDQKINQELPEFEIEVPEDFMVEVWAPTWEKKSMEVGMQVEDWTLPNQNDGQQTLSKEYASNVILLDFWATWCGPCKSKMPFVQKMHEKYKDKGLKVISILSSDAGHEKAAVAYIKKHKYTFDLVFDKKNEVSDKYKIRYLPTVIMIDKSGKIVHFRDTVGANDGIDEKVELEDAIKKALNI